MLSITCVNLATPWTCIEKHTPLSDLDTLLTRHTNKGIAQKKPPHYRTTLIHHCVEHDNIAALEYLLAKGCPVNAKNGLEETALHKACIKGNKPAVQLLLSYRAHPMIIDHLKETALFKAIRHDHSDIVCMLLNHNGHKHNTNIQGHIPLFFALYEGAYQSLYTMLYALKNAHTYKNKYNQTLYEASRSESDQRLQLCLLQYKDRMNKIDKQYADMTSILTRACSEKNKLNDISIICHTYKRRNHGKTNHM
jgi:ankyrin repeat protein